MLNTKSMGCEMLAIMGTVVTMKAALVYTLSLIWFVQGTSANTSQARKTGSLLLPTVTTLQGQTTLLLHITLQYIRHFSLCLRSRFFSPYHRNQLINCCLNSRLSKRKCVTLCVTLLMGSQSFSGDPYPCFHPLSRQTAHDCP